MAKGKKAGKGKAAALKQNKQREKKMTPKAVESTRSTRGSSRAPPEEKRNEKRKASQSPAPTKTAALAKKTQSASPSPAPASRVRPSRAASASAAKPEPKRQSRSTSQRKVETKPPHVTRAAIEEAEKKKEDGKQNKSRSSSRTKAPTTPAKSAGTPKKEASTPTQRRGRSTTARTPVVEKVKEVAVESPKQKGTPRGRSPRSKPATPQQKTTPKTKAATPKSRSVTPKERKAATPKKTPEKTPEKTSPKEKATPKRTPTPKKVTSPRAATATSPRKSTPTKTSPVRSTRGSPRKSATPSKTEEPSEPSEEKMVAEDEVIPAKEPETAEEVVDTIDEPVKEKGAEVAEELEEQEEDEEEAMEVDDEEAKEVEKQAESAVSDEDKNVENDVADDEIAEKTESVEQATEEEETKEVQEEDEKEDEDAEEVEEHVEDAQETEEPVEDAQETEEPAEDAQEAKEPAEDAQEAEEPVEDAQEQAEEEAEKQEVEVAEEEEQHEVQEERIVPTETKEAVAQQPETVVNEASKQVLEQVMKTKIPVAEKDDLEQASVLAQADESERMEELVAGLGDGESDIVGVDETSMQSVGGEVGSGDMGDSKSTEEAPCQAAAQETSISIVEVPDGEIEETEVNKTGIEIAQEVQEDSGDAMINDAELNDITPIQIDEGSSSLSNGEQPPSTSPRKRKHDEVEDEDFQSIKKARVSESSENIQEPYTNGDGSAEVEDITKDYVVIEMEDVPPSESQEVIASVPKETVQNITSEEGAAVEPQSLEQTKSQSAVESNPVYNRVFIPNPNFGGAVDTLKQFSVVSYNVLADCHLFRNDYSFTHPDYLEPDYRLNKLMEEIQFLDADIVCLQEVDPDFFQDQLLPHMKGHGYDGFHKKRTEEFYDEGEATFYRMSRFTLVDISLLRVADLVEKEFVEGMDATIQGAVRQYMDRSDVLVVTKLQCNNSGQQITVGNIHVTWGEMKVPDVQVLQVACAIKEIVNKAGSAACPHIICGDFNSEPFSPGYLMAKEGYISDEGTINGLQQLKNLEFPDGRRESLVNCMWSGFQHTSSSLRSTYHETQGREPDVTSYNRVMCACVDYIFYSSSSLDTVGILQTAPKDKIMETGGLPNCYFPSDHVSMKAVLSFK